MGKKERTLDYQRTMSTTLGSMLRLWIQARDKLTWNLLQQRSKPRTRKALPLKNVILLRRVLKRYLQMF